MLIVKKFGGTSLANKEKVLNAAKRCIEDYQKGHDIVVVLSAMGKTTDELLAKAYDIHPSPSKRELDMLLSTGEQISVAIMAMVMNSLNVPAVSLNAMQIQMQTTSSYGNASLKKIETQRIQHELEMRKIVLVTGFQGVNRYDDITTLGRGGSYTTAVAVAAALHADTCEIYTDVDGVYTADPNIVTGAKKLNEISYDEMLKFSALGAKVLHNRSVELAKKYGVQLIVRSSLNKTEGTLVKEDVKVEKKLVSGVAIDKSTAKVSVLGLADQPGIAFKLFHGLSKKNVNVDIILQSTGSKGNTDITFTIPKVDLQRTLDILEQNQELFTIQHIESEKEVAKLSIVGAGMASNPGVATKFFEALYAASINIKMISTSEISITALVAEEDAERALKIIHEAFFISE